MPASLGMTRGFPKELQTPLSSSIGRSKRTIFPLLLSSTFSIHRIQLRFLKQQAEACDAAQDFHSIPWEPNWF
jgi:hypothetical protein